MNGDEVFALMVKTPGFLDKPIEELVQMRAVGQVYLDTHKSILKQIKSGQIHLAEGDRAIKLQEGQAIGKALLDVEARIGELLPTDARGMKLSEGASSKNVLPDFFGDTRNKRHKGATAARTIANNPQAVEEVIREAEANDDIPTKTAVLNKVRAQKAEAAVKKYKEEVKENTKATTGDALKYLSKLREIVMILPSKVPAEGWTDDSYGEAKAMVEIINKRLGAWNE